MTTPDHSRRRFLLTSLSTTILPGLTTVLGGCGEQRTASMLPEPAWDTVLFDPGPAQPSYSPAAEPYIDPEPEPVIVSNPAPPRPAATGIIARRAWSRGNPIPTRMNRMLPVRFITVHHDARVNRDTNQAAVARRIDAIRRYHQNDRGWGDIGYHYVVDRAGRVWEARPLGWQGAHVKDRNPGNIGVVALGNFDNQSPSTAQVNALMNHVRGLMDRYRVPVSRVRTHQEWAATACPGRNLQRIMVQSRRGGALA